MSVEVVVPKGVSGIFQLTVVTSDFEASRRFYTQGIGAVEVVEWQEAAINGQPVRFNGLLLSVGSGTHIELIRAQGSPADQHSFPLDHFSFATDDCAEVYRRALAAGGRPHAMNPGWDGRPAEAAFSNGRMRLRVAFLKGPSGEVVGLSQMLSPLA